MKTDSFHRVFVRDGRRVAGRASLVAVPGDLSALELSMILVLPELRGQGFGTRLLHDVIERARRLGAITLRLKSGKTWPQGFKLASWYKRHGFVKHETFASSRIMTRSCSTPITCASSRNRGRIPCNSGLDSDAKSPTVEESALSLVH